MISLLFAVTILAQAANPSPAPEAVPEQQRFNAPPEGFADPTEWSGADVRFTEWEQTEGTPAFDYLQKRRVCTAGAQCTLEGRFEHNLGPDAAAPTQHVDRFALVGPAGRLEVFVHQAGPQAVLRFFRLDIVGDRTASGGRTAVMWMEVKAGDPDRLPLETFHKYLSMRAAAAMQQAR